MHKLVCVGFLFIILCISINKELYQNNDVPINKVDDTIFMIDDNNYKEIRYKNNLPQKGTYTDFVNTFDIYNYSDYFDAPQQSNNITNIDKLSNNKDNIYQYQFRNVDDTISSDDNKLDKDPSYVYGSAKYRGNKLIHEKWIIDRLSENKLSEDKIIK